MADVKWAISPKIFLKPGFPKIEDALIKNGIEYFVSDYDESTRTYADIPYSKDECVVFYGPIKYIRTQNKGFFPGAFGFSDNTNTSSYMSEINMDLFFNHDAIYLPFGAITHNKDKLSKIFCNDIFIRPDSGFKTFTGISTTIDKLDFELSSIKQISNPGNNEMCLISSAKEIYSEYRMVICDREVVTGSQYRWNGKLDVRIDVHHEAWACAESVSKLQWQPDVCYVVDIFMGERGPRIGEFNSFACSGLYNCDLNKIVTAVSKTAKDEFYV